MRSYFKISSYTFFPYYPFFTPIQILLSIMPLIHFTFLYITILYNTLDFYSFSFRLLLFLNITFVGKFITLLSKQKKKKKGVSLYSSWTIIFFQQKYSISVLFLSGSFSFIVCIYYTIYIEVSFGTMHDYDGPIWTGM